MKMLLLFLVSFGFMAQGLSEDQMVSLSNYSDEVNKELPEVYDSVTKLMKSSVENNNFTYHFVLDANQAEYNFALPKVKTQILKTICSQKRERIILKNYKSSIVYSYENTKGQSLGVFMVKPSFCK